MRVYSGRLPESVHARLRAEVAAAGSFAAWVEARLGGEVAPIPPRVPVRERMVRLLTEEGPMPATEIAARLGVRYETVATVLSRGGFDRIGGRPAVWGVE